MQPSAALGHRVAWLGMLVILALGLGIWLARPAEPEVGVAWLVAAGNAIRHAPVLADGRLFVTADDSHLYAFAARDGKLLWDDLLTSPATAAPVLHAGRLMVASGDGRLLAVEPATGKVHWQLQLGEPAGTLAAAGKGLLVLTDTGRVWSLDPANGGAYGQWRSDPVANGVAGLADGGALLTYVDGHLERRDKVGRVVWATAPGTTAARWPQVNARGWFVTADNGWVVQVDPAKGKVLHSWRTGPLVTAPVHAGEGFYAATTAGRVYAVGLGGWMAELSVPAEGPPLPVGQVVVVPCTDQRARALDAATGQLVWKLDTRADVTAPMVAGDGWVWFGSWRGEVAALKLP